MNEEIPEDGLPDAPQDPKRPEPGPVVPFMADEDIDLRPPATPEPTDEEYRANGSRLIVNGALKLLKEVEGYPAYLRTGHWQEVRRRALIAASFRCQVCLKKVPLDVHHLDRTYACLGNEQPDDVIALCSGPKGCHTHEHEVWDIIVKARAQQQFNREHDPE